MNNLDTKTIYEIFRSCRLCGAGGGYKMPIIPSAVGLDCAEIELQQKIRECLQIEVHQEDKMPPLICELCVDKVNDYFEFLEMCRQTNRDTRQRLGLPMQMTQASEENCILGVTEPVFIQNSEDEQPARKFIRLVKVKDDKKVVNKGKDTLNKETESCINYQESSSPRQRRLANRGSRDSSTSSSSKQSSSKPEQDLKLTRLRAAVKSSDDEDALLVPIKKKPKIEKRSDTKQDPKSQKVSRPEARALRFKSNMQRDEHVPLEEHKKIKSRITYEEPDRDPAPPAPASGPSTRPGPSTRSGPKPGNKLDSSRAPTSLAPTGCKPKSKAGPASRRAGGGPSAGAEAAAVRRCAICALACTSPQGLASHLRQHAVRFTPHSLACNPCGEWFASADEVAAHHKWHKSAHVAYACRACAHSFRALKDYNRHMEAMGASHVPRSEAGAGAEAERCAACDREFPTRARLRAHKCAGAAEARASGKCFKCNKYYNKSGLRKHEAACVEKIKEPVVREPRVRVPASVRRRLLPACVRVARCDGLLRGRAPGASVRVGGLPPDYGLDPRSGYPYRALVQVKREPLAADGMVSIHKEVRDQVYKEEEYVHWDSDNSSDSDIELSLSSERTKRIPSLTALTLKTIYSRQCLGKLPRKLRKVKHDNLDSLFNTEVELDVKSGTGSTTDDTALNDQSGTGSTTGDTALNDQKRFEETIANNKILTSDTLSETDKRTEGFTNHETDYFGNPSVDQDNIETDLKSTDDVTDADACTSSGGRQDGNVTNASMNVTEAKTIGFGHNIHDHIEGNVTDASMNETEAKANGETNSGDLNINDHIDGNVTDAANETEAKTIFYGHNIHDHIDGNVTDAAMNETEAKTISYGHNIHDNIDGNVTDAAMNEIEAKTSSDVLNIHDHNDDNIHDHNDDNLADVSMQDTEAKQHSDGSNIYDHNDGIVTDETEAITNRDGLNIREHNNGNVTDVSMNETDSKTQSDVLKSNIDDNIINDAIHCLLEDGKENHNLAEKSCQGLENGVTGKITSHCDTGKVNGGCGNDPDDLISEINELYDKKLMDDLDAEIGI